MGQGFEMNCSKCGYSFCTHTGIGFTFMTVYEKTVQKAKNGELGKEIQEFFKDHPDGTINAEYVTLCCDDCGELFTGQDLTMYVPNQTIRKKKEYVMEDDLEHLYTEYKKYPHKCEKCGGRAHIVEDEETMLCPKCKIPLDEVGHIFWD